jgi:hypothetical protein
MKHAYSRVSHEKHAPFLHRLDLIERDFLDLRVRVRARTNYASVLASLPEELRRAYRDGDFSVGIRDADFQVIPTAWVLAAEARWKPDGAHGSQ